MTLPIADPAPPYGYPTTPREARIDPVTRTVSARKACTTQITVESGGGTA